MRTLGKIAGAALFILVALLWGLAKELWNHLRLVVSLAWVGTLLLAAFLPNPPEAVPDWSFSQANTLTTFLFLGKIGVGLVAVAYILSRCLSTQQNP